MEYPPQQLAISKGSPELLIFFFFSIKLKILLNKFHCEFFFMVFISFYHKNLYHLATNSLISTHAYLNKFMLIALCHRRSDLTF